MKARITEHFSVLLLDISTWLRSNTRVSSGFLDTWAFQDLFLGPSLSNRSDIRGLANLVAALYDFDVDRIPAAADLAEKGISIKQTFFGESLLAIIEHIPSNQMQTSMLGLGRLNDK